MEKEIIKPKATASPVPNHPTGEAQVRHKARPHSGPGRAQARPRSQGVAMELTGSLLSVGYPWTRTHPLGLRDRAALSSSLGRPLPHTALLSKRKPGPSLVLESYLQWLVFEIPFSHLLPPEAGSHFLSLIGAPGQGCFLSTCHPGPWQPGPHWLGASLPFQERSLPFPLQVASSFEHPRKPCLRSLRERQSLGGLNMQRV